MLKKRISGISVENLLSRSNEKLRRRTLLSLKKVLVSKIFMHRRGGHHGIVENYLSQRTENFVSAPFCVSETFWYGKNYGGEIWEGEGRVSRFSVEIFLSNSAEIVRRGTLVCFEKLPISSIFMHRRGRSRYLTLCIRRGYQEFLSKLSCLAVKKNFAGEPF